MSAEVVLGRGGGGKCVDVLRIRPPLRSNEVSQRNRRKEGTERLILSPELLCGLNGASLSRQRCRQRRYG